MEWLCFLLFAVVTVNCYEVLNDKQNKTRVVGGSYISIKEVPYQAQIIADDDTVCGATIISEYWLVSAAHCFIGNNEELSVSTGSSRSFSGQKHEIEKHIVHPKYSYYNHNDNDIALIKLKNPIKLNENQYPIPLATGAPKVGDFMKISGYGWESLRKRRSNTRRHLKSAELYVVSHSTCVKRYEEIYAVVTSNSFCARGPTGGSCTADSGGPGVIGGKLAGIVSAGYECNTAYYPVIYTRVHLYREWIEEQTGVK